MKTLRAILVSPAMSATDATSVLHATFAFYRWPVLVSRPQLERRIAPESERKRVCTAAEAVFEMLRNWRAVFPDVPFIDCLEMYGLDLDTPPDRGPVYPAPCPIDDLVEIVTDPAFCRAVHRHPDPLGAKGARGLAHAHIGTEAWIETIRGKAPDQRGYCVYLRPGDIYVGNPVTIVTLSEEGAVYDESADRGAIRDALAKARAAASASRGVAVNDFAAFVIQDRAARALWAQTFRPARPWPTFRAVVDMMMAFTGTDHEADAAASQMRRCFQLLLYAGTSPSELQVTSAFMTTAVMFHKVVACMGGLDRYQHYDEKNSFLEELVDLCKQPGFYGSIKPARATEILEQYPRDSYRYLFRLSDGAPGDYTVSVRTRRDTLHMRLGFEPNSNDHRSIGLRASLLVAAKLTSLTGELGWFHAATADSPFLDMFAHIASMYTASASILASRVDEREVDRTVGYGVLSPEEYDDSLDTDLNAADRAFFLPIEAGPADATARPIKPRRHCTVCLRADNIRVCARCAAASYCSVDCQEADWKTHQTVCAH